VNQPTDTIPAAPGLRHSRDMRGRTAIAAVMAASIGLGAISLAPAELVHAVFLHPAARIAALYLGLPCVEDPGAGYIIPHPALRLAVVPECSGFTFYTILCSFLLFQAFRRFDARRAVPAAIGIVLAALPAALLANALRLVACLYAFIIMPPGTPRAIANTAHLWIGVLVFVPALVLAYYLFERRFAHDR